MPPTLVHSTEIRQSTSPLRLSINRWKQLFEKSGDAKLAKNMDLMVKSVDANQPSMALSLLQDTNKAIGAALKGEWHASFDFMHLTLENLYRLVHPTTDEFMDLTQLA